MFQTVADNVTGQNPVTRTPIPLAKFLELLKLAPHPFTDQHVAEALAHIEATGVVGVVEPVEKGSVEGPQHPLVFH